MQFLASTTTTADITANKINRLETARRNLTPEDGAASRCGNAHRTQNLPRALPRRNPRAGAPETPPPSSDIGISYLVAGRTRSKAKEETTKQSSHLQETSKELKTAAANPYITQASIEIDR